MNTSPTLIAITILIFIAALWFLYDLQLRDAELQGNNCFVSKRNFILIGGAILAAIAMIFAIGSMFSKEKFIYSASPVESEEDEEGKEY
jgi:hypothetical protein